MFVLSRRIPLLKTVTTVSPQIIILIIKKKTGTFLNCPLFSLLFFFNGMFKDDSLNRFKTIIIILQVYGIFSLLVITNM